MRIMWLLLLAGCDWSAQRMVDQERCQRDEPTALFADGDCNRLPPEGVVPYGRRQEARPELSLALLQRGRDRFDIFCAPCHGLLGDGRSQVAENMLLRPPPSLHEPRLVTLEDAKLFAVISDGYGLMPAYRSSLEPADRWAVVAYVRALARSQDVPLEQLPPQVRKEAEPWLR